MEILEYVKISLNNLQDIFEMCFKFRYIYIFKYFIITEECIEECVRLFLITCLLFQSCKADLVREDGYKYFLKVLADPSMPVCIYAYI